VCCKRAHIQFLFYDWLVIISVPFRDYEDEIPSCTFGAHIHVRSQKSLSPFASFHLPSNILDQFLGWLSPRLNLTTFFLCWQRIWSVGDGDCSAGAIGFHCSNLVTLIAVSYYKGRRLQYWRRRVVTVPVTSILLNLKDSINIVTSTSSML
jgi:hypothetical protein